MGTVLLWSLRLMAWVGFAVWVDAPIPPCPVPGHKWGAIVHNNKVQWLAMFKDTINNHIKYVWFSNSSSFKGKSDKKKFEKARELKVRRCCKCNASSPLSLCLLLCVLIWW